MGGKSRWDLIPFRSPFPVRSVSSQERDWQNDNTRCQAPLPTQRPSLRYQLLGWALRSTRHLPWDSPGLRDRATRKPSHGGQLLSELGSKSLSVLQKNIFQTGSLSPRLDVALKALLELEFPTSRRYLDCPVKTRFSPELGRDLGMKHPWQPLCPSLRASTY